MPFFQTFSDEISHPGISRLRNCSRRRSRETPASTNAPRAMSPLIPLKQSKYASFMELNRCMDTIGALGESQTWPQDEKEKCLTQRAQRGEHGGPRASLGSAD